MSSFLPDRSGIYSLGGFSYQIKVFAYFALCLKPDEELGFETWDDIAITTIKSDTFDTHADDFKSTLKGNNGITAIQVKRTDLNVKTCKQVILNWILLENSMENVKNYILWVDDGYENNNILFNVTSDELFEDIRMYNGKSSKAARKKAHDLFVSDKKGFTDIYERVRAKFQFAKYDVDDSIYKACEILFKRAGVHEAVYALRVDAFLKKITSDVLDKINIFQPYTLTYTDLMQFTEDICENFTLTVCRPNYADFKKVNSVDLKALGVAQSREYRQLLACTKDEYTIKTNLTKEMYYQMVRYSYMELNRKNSIECIEDTAFDNFYSARENLLKTNRDTPYNRFHDTLNASNSYADNEQIRDGVCIFLTREDEDEHQITWEEEGQ